MTPMFKITADSVDVTHLIRDRLLSLIAKDNAGIKSDSLEIKLDDAKHEIELPRTGASLDLFLGYAGAPLNFIGKYTVDEVEVFGPPSSMLIRAKAADLTKSLKEPKTRTWQHAGKSPGRFKLKDILNTIAREHQLTPNVSAEFASLDYEVVNQTNEHDLNLLSRLAEKAGAVVKPANGYLLLVKKGEAKTVSGSLIPTIQIEPKDVTNWRASLVKRGAYGSVSARYRDLDIAEEVEVSTGDDAPTYQISKPVKDEAAAVKAANAQLDKFKRGESTLSLTMPGDTRLIAESVLSLSGFRTGANGLWLAENVTHSLTRAGFTTSVDGSAHFN